MQQKVIWFVLFLIICGLTFYIVVIRPTEIDENTTIKKDHEELIMEVNETTVIHEDFEKMWIGRGKHIETIQETAEDFRKTYDAKMKDIEKEFDVVDNNITKAEERLNKLIEDVEEEIEDLEKKHKTFKKKTDRKIKDIEYKIIPPIKSDLKGLGDDLTKIVDLPLIQKEIQKVEESKNASNPN
tara:strand:- start:4938 stop:5489 length:552 start_codon:yes stop_codon:yes gene_type:complete